MQESICGIFLEKFIVISYLASPAKTKFSRMLEPSLKPALEVFFGH